jgi:glucose-6-phosphate isomerase, archaeal
MIMGDKKLFEPFGIDLDLIEGILQDSDSHLVRNASSMRGHYADEEALEELIRNGDPLHYEVFSKDIPEASGHLHFGISKLQPGTVGDEFFMTKGHYHSIAETAEVYVCLRGQGYMLMKTTEGECRSEYMERGRVVYVPPCWAHRSVNVGNEPVITFYVYPGDAGHNYGDIEEEGFPKRIYKRGGKIEII